MYIAHLSIWVNDIKKIKTFYERYFGAQESAHYSNTQKKFQSYFLSFSSGARLEIMHRPDISFLARHAEQEFLGYAHLAMAVDSKSAVDALTMRLVTDGIQCLDGPRWTGDGYYESVVLDPEGNRIEITAKE